jgi:EAL domain-containing protein (putative c-di-GMP-specific phosphodiesterase class I)/GGDEF domain-containing protein/putative methionine-R-sulfoxide reductase with GAF domain
MARAATQLADDFRGLLEPGAIRALFQPIVRLSDLGVIGYEGLARFPTPPGLVALPPDVTLAAAGRSGVRHDLEVACWASIASAGVPPHGRLLWVNLSPEALGHPGLLEVAGRLPSRLVIELTEQDAVLNNELLRERLRPWLARGALVAVDDAGAGFTSLEYVASIRPDFLKLCRGMVTEIDADPARQAVLRATVAFAREVGARVVAEGVERPEELEVLRDADVDYGQGWLFGRPAAPWPQDPGAPEARTRPRPAPVGRLERDLEGAEDPHGAAEAVADHLARRGLLARVYLMQAGRLRCHAARGYWQVNDGLPATSGLIGRVFRSGEPVVVDDVADATDHEPSMPAVTAEAYLPLTVAGQVVGVLATEALTTLDARAVADLGRCARLLSARLEEVGAVPPASPAQRVARAAARLASLEDPEDLVREALAAARDLSGYESGLVALADGHGALYPHLAEGPFAVAFSQLESEELAAVAAWVEHATSGYTVGDSTGRGFAGHDALRRVGATSLVVLPLAAAGRRHGVVVLADRGPRRLATEDVELLELLATQAAAGLRMATAVVELRERAARDPLTGLGHHASFYAALPTLAGPVGVLVADVDGFKAINDLRGHAEGDDVLRALAGLLREITPARGRAFRIGGDEFAVALEAASPGELDALGWELRSLAPGRLGTTLSTGFALARPDEPLDALVPRASAALAAD